MHIKEKVRFLEAVDQMGNLRTVRLRDWARSTAVMTRRVASATASESDAALFWIRLHGLFGEFRREIDNKRKMVEETFAWGEPLDAEHRYSCEVFRAHFAQALGAIDVAAADLTEAERTYLDLRRTIECHPWQNAFELRGDGGMGLLTTRTVFGVKRDLDEVEKDARATEANHGGSSLSVAIAVANKLVAHVEAIPAAIEPLLRTTIMSKIELPKGF